MPPIAQIGTKVTVTPAEEVQIIYSPGNHEFVDDRSPFAMMVEGVLKQEGQVVGVYGSVVSGHERYCNQIATLLVRLEGSDWRRDNRSAAGFWVGKSIAHPNGKYPVYHPEGGDIEGFPYIIRFGSIDSRSTHEPEVNSALKCEPPDSSFTSGFAL